MLKCEFEYEIGVDMTLKLIFKVTRSKSTMFYMECNINFFVWLVIVS